MLFLTNHNDIFIAILLPTIFVRSHWYKAIKPTGSCGCFSCTMLGVVFALLRCSCCHSMLFFLFNKVVDFPSHRLFQKSSVSIQLSIFSHISYIKFNVVMGSTLLLHGIPLIVDGPRGTLTNQVAFDVFWFPNMALDWSDTFEGEDIRSKRHHVWNEWHRWIGTTHSKQKQSTS